MVSAIVPRPIAFVSTQSPDGLGNLAPFSYFNAVASNPPVLMISITSHPDGREKDTLRNIRETGEFVVNISTESMAEAVNQCSAQYPYGVNELEKVGLTPMPSHQVKPTRVLESPIQLECKLYHLLPIGSGGAGSTVVVFGEIIEAHVHESLFDPAHPKNILSQSLQPLSRLGGNDYGTLGRVFSLPRPGKTV